jgi:serine/threonine-protein kinase
MATHAVKTCSVCGREFDARAVFCPYDGGHLGPVNAPAITIEGDPATPTRQAPQIEGDDPLLGRVLDRRYRLLKRVGRGGMGTVYRATHVELNRLFAIKILNFELAGDPIATRRFRREAEALGAISHPNAVSVSDVGVTEEGLAYIVMELLEGFSLRAVVMNEAPLSLGRTVNIVRQICGAVTAAHQVGIIHRDVKPDNIMLVRSESGDEVAKVLDFGIARLVHSTGKLTSRLTARDVVLGTPRYMSPEACEGKELTHATDIYSLGIILYEMLAGRVPFDGTTALDVAVRQVSEPPPPLAGVRPDLPPGVESVVMGALAKESELRPATAVELAEQLEAAAQLPSRATSPVARVHTPARGLASVATLPSAPAARPAAPARPLEVGLSAGVVAALIALGALLGLAIVAALAYFMSPSAGRGAAEPRERVIGLPPAPPEGMVFVPEGAFTMGEDGWDGPPTWLDEMNRPAHAVWTNAFFIDAHEVTNAQYAEFLTATGRPAPERWGRGPRPEGWERLPVTYVTWFDATAYAQWAGKRLPTESEWERTARGEDARIYPWGDEWDPSRVVCVASGVAGPLSVGSRPGGASPYQAMDMSGNVYEWTASDFAPYAKELANPEPNRLLKIIRGGSYSSKPQWLRTSFRVWIDPRSRHPNLGFRCARSVDGPA